MPNVIFHKNVKNREVKIEKAAFDVYEAIPDKPWHAKR